MNVTRPNSRHRIASCVNLHNMHRLAATGHLLALLACLIPAHAKQTRFARALALYQGLHAATGRRTTDVLLRRVKAPSHAAVEPTTGDTTITYGKTLQATLGYHLSRTVITPRNERYHVASASLTGSHIGSSTAFRKNTHESSGGGTPAGGFDTTDMAAVLAGDVSSRFLWLLHAGSPGVPLLIEQSVSAFLRTSYTKTKNHDPDLANDILPNEYKADRFVRRTQQAILTMDFAPGITLGRQVDVMYLAEALDIENALRECGAARFDLAEGTLASLAVLLARNSSYHLRQHGNMTRFKRELDNLLGHDVAVDPERLRYLSPFQVKRITLRHSPPMLSGLSVRLLTDMRATLRVTRTRHKFPFDSSPNSDTAYFRPDFSCDVWIGGLGSWGIPVNRFFRLCVSVLRQSFTTVCDSTAGIPDPVERALDLRWSLLTTIQPTLWLLIEAGLTDVPAWIVVPRYFPYETHARVSIFVEDYLKLTTGLSFYMRKGMNREARQWWSPLAPLPDGLELSVSVAYDF